MDPTVTFKRWQKYVSTMHSADLATVEGTWLIEWLHMGGFEPDWGSANNRDTFFAWAIFRNIPWASAVSSKVARGNY